MMLLAGCQYGESSLLAHPIVQALIAKVTGQEPTTLEEAAENLTDAQREAYKKKYKGTIDAFRQKRARELSDADDTGAATPEEPSQAQDPGSSEDLGPE